MRKTASSTGIADRSARKAENSASVSATCGTRAGMGEEDTRKRDERREPREAGSGATSTASAVSRRYLSGRSELSEETNFRAGAQLRERPLSQLPDALSRHAEGRADLFEGAGVFGRIEAIVE